MSLMKSAVAAALIVAVSLPAAAQQVTSAEDIVRSLQSGTPVAARSLDADTIVSGLRSRFATQPASANAPLKSISVVPGAPVVEAPVVTAPPVDYAAVEASVGALPSLDMEIFFDYDSATIKPESFPTLVELGRALTDPRLAGSRFIVAGHTDAAGSNAYNLALSEARAASVRNALVSMFPIDPSGLLAFGFGEEQLRVPQHPTAAVNRRVQVMNLGY